MLYAILCAPMVFLLVECARGMYCDVHLIRETALQQEISHLRSEATRHAGELETAMKVHQSTGDWPSLEKAAWLRSFWDGLKLPPHNLYAAVVDLSGKIVLHTDPQVVSQELEPRWYREAVPDAGYDVVRLENASLSNRAAAYDLHVPISLDGRRIAEYHQGLDGEWFDSHVSSKQRDVLEKWMGLLGAAVLIDIAGILALISIARRDRRLSSFAWHGPRELAGRLGQIASGLAHEIRNPLHALRINLHTLRRSFSGRAQLDHDDLMMTIAQSDRAIDTLESLMRDLLRFTTLENGEKAEVNVANELRATLNLMNEEMRRKQVEVDSHLPPETVSIAIDPSRLRQILVNLLTFAQNNAGPGGRIHVEVIRNAKMAYLDVSDSGPTLTEAQQLHVFDPFQAPRETGSGLGLALVKCFAEQVGGTAECVQGGNGCHFRIRLPLFKSERQGFKTESKG